jgi:hypothetical protein
MKNPMDRTLEKRLSDRAVAIGREGEVAAFGELLTLLKSSSANARRLAASALGKLAWLGVHAVALKAYGAAAKGCLHDFTVRERRGRGGRGRLP